MAFSRITDTDIQTQGLQAETGEKLTGTVAENKLRHDQLPTFIATKLMAIVDELEKQTDTSGAEQIGCKAITGVNSGEAGTIREMLVDLKNQLTGITLGDVDDGSISENKLTATAVMLSVLSGYTKPSSTSALSATDTVKQALGKLEQYISNILDGTATADTASNYASGGTIESALAGKQATLTFDDEPTVSSINPVTSDGLVPNNTLTSTSTAQSLSAAKGKDLKDQLDLKPNLTSIKDWVGSKQANGTSDVTLALSEGCTDDIVAIEWHIGNNAHKIDYITASVTYNIKLSQSYGYSGGIRMYSFTLDYGGGNYTLKDAYLTEISSAGAVSSSSTTALYIDDIYKVKES